MYWTCLYRAFIYARRWKIKIILYHNIERIPGDVLSRFDISLSPAAFEKHLKFFRKYYNVISLNELVDRLNKGMRIPNALVITFDDGFLSFKEHAIPIIEEHNVSVTMFLTTSVIDNKKLIWRHLFAFLISKYGEVEIVEHINSYLVQNKIIAVGKIANGDVNYWLYRNYHKEIVDGIINSLLIKYGIQEAELAKSLQLYLSRENIRKAPEHLITFGSHSVYHPVFSKLRNTEMEQELLDSYEFLKQNLGVDRFAFAYPFGMDTDHSEESDRPIRECPGYFCSLKVGGENSWRTSAFDLKRTDVHTSTIPKLFVEIELMPWLKSLVKHIYSKCHTVVS